jgi:hypothetical protein
MKGKAWNAASASALIDEDPRAYKDIRQVMADQSDLTEVLHVLTRSSTTRAPADEHPHDAAGRRTRALITAQELTATAPRWSAAREWP